MADLRSLVIKEFSSPSAQRRFREMADQGLWDSEMHFVEKYFTNSRARVLDLGCGTGRTTIPLVQRNFDVIGVDLTPAMIETAVEIAAEKDLTIKYEVGDATRLHYPDGFFDYVLFSNQGWTQIPGRKNRLAALGEIRRVLKSGGIFIFTTHQRAGVRRWTPFWIKQAFRFYVLKRLGFAIPEMDFGDRFFNRDSTDDRRTYANRQYIHIPTLHEVKSVLEKAGFALLEVNGSMQISRDDVRKYPPVFFVCEKSA
ncbi:MAG: class I SAM-dependent methyltransferase [Deltaproteobacteria bacterium]|nr:class I SAM-dependent methyltransferase [Deltaproteobacteria bacterium]